MLNGWFCSKCGLFRAYSALATNLKGNPSMLCARAANPMPRARFVIIWCIIYGAGSQEFTLKTNTSCSSALAGRTAIYYLFIVIAESLPANTTQRWTNYYNFTNHIIRPTRAHSKALASGERDPFLHY